VVEVVRIGAVQVHFPFLSFTIQPWTGLKSQSPCLLPHIESTCRFNGDLCLEKVDVLGEVQCVLAAVSDHVCIQHIVRASEHACQMRLVGGAMQRTLQESNQQVDYLYKTQNSLNVKS